MQAASLFVSYLRSEKFMAAVLELHNIDKRFGKTHTLDHVSFVLRSKEVLALLGDNGAGKSTLVKIISGVDQPDSGSMVIRGRQVDFSTYSVSKARQLGVETVHQENCLGNKQFLWRNMFMGRHITNCLGFIRVTEEKRQTQALLKEYLGLNGVGMNEESVASTLSGGEKQGIAIARALFFDSDILVLDEPTTALSVKEVKKVLHFISGIKQRGKSCILITHNMAHAYQVADRFVLLERGQLEGVYEKKDFSMTALTEKLFEVASRENVL